MSQATYLSAYTPSAYGITSVFLDIALSSQATRVVGTLHITPYDHTQPLILHGQNLILNNVLLNGQSVPYVLHDDGTLTLPAQTHDAQVQIDVTINPTANTALEGLYRSGNLYCTQCEPHGFRHIMYFIDRPDVLSVYTVRLIGDSTTPILLSNGNLREKGTTADGLPYAVWHDPFPKPSYLFAIAAGDLSVLQDVYTTRSGRRILLEIYTEPAYATRCDFAMQSLKKAMAWDEQYYNLEYDLDCFMILAVSDFNMGAMENKGLNIFNIKYIAADIHTATDADYEGIEAVVAHEYFHNYTGNRVTCRDWFQLCLKEGLTVYRDQEFSASVRGKIVKRLQDTAMLRRVQFSEDAGALAHPVRPAQYMAVNNLYTSTVYEKGAEICRMMAITVGEDIFRQGVEYYLRQYDGQAVTVEQFISSLSTYTQQDLSSFLVWYTHMGTPVLHITLEPDAQQGVVLHCRQYMLNENDTTPRPIPLRIGFVTPQGDSGINDLFVLTQSYTALHFKDIASPAVPSLLRQFSAPVRLEYDYSNNDLLCLAQHDSDAYNRLYACEILATRLITAAELFDQTQAYALCHAMLQMAQCTTDDTTMRAYALQLPALSLLIQQVKDADVAHLFAQRTCLQQHLAVQGENLWAKILRMPTPTDLSVESTAIRALRNAALELQNRLEWHTGQSAYAQYSAAQTMTDKMAALRTLVHGDSAHKETALHDFFVTYQHDATVIDKWFTVQATAPRLDALTHVQKLAQHQHFTLHNPNRVRALWGGFAHSNLIGFANHAGFSALAQVIVQLDAINPQGAARLASAYEIIDRLPLGVRIHTREILQDILTKKTISVDTRDILQKIMAV